MKKIEAYEQTTEANGKICTIIVIEIENTWEAYISDGNKFEFMFGLMKNEYSAEKTMEIALANIEDYAYLLDEE